MKKRGWMVLAVVMTAFTLAGCSGVSQQDYQAKDRPARCLGW